MKAYCVLNLQYKFLNFTGFLFGMYRHGKPYLCSTAPDTVIQKKKRSYVDSRARRNLSSINTELQDVQRIMVANIEEVLQRGEALSGNISP